MRGDFTRNTFDPRKHYSRVLMQQGRVQLDADWNEQAAIFTHFLRALARDLIGPWGAPFGSHGFQIVTKIADVRKFDGSPLGPNDKDLQNTLKNGLKDSFVINAGTYYVDGIRVENALPTLYPHPDKSCLVYLDVWERHITCIEDPHIREVALGGPDTTTRAQIVWQVRICDQANDPNDPNNPCGLGNVPTRPGTGQLRAYAGAGATPPSPCVIAPSSSYRGAENQLYRVEIHDPGDATEATFKWSREDGSVVFPVVEIGTAAGDGSSTTVTLTLATLGRDDKLGLHTGDWVELVDDAYEMASRADALLQVTGIVKDQLQVTLVTKGTLSVAADAVKDNLLLRRWDQGSAAIAVVETPAGDANYGKWLPLEDGVVVTFVGTGDANAPAQYRTGDYWLIPARVATGNIEWPQVTDGTKSPPAQAPAALPPDGPRHHYAPLGIFSPVAGTAAANVAPCGCNLDSITVCSQGQASTKPKPAPASPGSSRRGNK